MDDRVLDWIRSHHFGKYRGTVVDHDKDRGRIKVSCPAVLGKVELWALPCVPYAGDKVGLFTLPPKGAAIWVEFEGGKANCPIWAGCFWGTGQLPKEAKNADVKVLKTKNAIVSIDDKANKILLQVTGGAEITVEKGQWTGKKGVAKVTTSTKGVKIEGSSKTLVDVQAAQIVIAQ